MFNSPISTNRFHHSPNSPFTHPFAQNPQPSAFTSSPSVPNLDNIEELPLPTKLTKASSSNHTGLSTRESSIDVIKQRSRKESFENDGFFSPCFSKEFEPSMSFDDEEIQLKRLPALKASDFEIIIDVIPRNLIMSSETSLVYPCYASLRLKQDLYVEKPGLDILLILDIKDHEISSIINILQNVLPHLSEHDRLALFTTQGTCAKRLPFKVMDEPSKSTFINECYSIKELSGRSRNSLKNVLQTSLEAVKNRKYENHLAAIFLITDSAEEIALDQIIQKDIFSPQQPIIYAFGLGQKHNPVNLAQVCEHFEGAYSYAENFHALEKSLKNRISQLGDIQAKNIKIKIQTNPFQLTKIYDKNIINEESTQFYETQRNYLSLRKGVDLALEIQVPKWTEPISEIQHCPSSIKLDFSCENLFHSGEISVQYTREFDIKIVPSFEHEISKSQVDLKSLEKFCEVKMLVRYFQVLMMVNYGLVGHGIQVLNGLKTDLSAFTKFGGVQIKQIMKMIEWTIEGLDSSRLKTRDMLMLIQHVIY